jgi:uncharacterized protein YndB with AHSA1/START domain
MTNGTHNGRNTVVSRVIKAPRHRVYQAFLEPGAVETWMAPGTMTAQVHTFEPREGGAFRITLTYHEQDGRPAGKSSENTDTYQGHFGKLIPGELVEQIIEFESDDPQIAGVMRMTARLTETPEGTRVDLACDDIPAGIRLEDNVTGCELSLGQLAALLEI